MRTTRELVHWLAAAALVFLSWGQASASILSYDINVANGIWFGSGPPPFGLPADRTLSGSVTVDNTQTGLAAFVSFSLATGTHAARSPIS